jgi:serine O-acetyltransferase
MNPWKSLKADTYRQYGRFNWGSLIKGAITRRTFRAVVTMRLCQGAAASRGIFRLTLPCFQVLHRLAADAAGIDLPWRTEIGGGLSLTHGWGLVVNQEARIGNNVTLFHGVTLGQRDHISREGKRFTEYPVLEDEVWVGPHAIIVGGIIVGRGSRISGGAFVTESIPPHSLVSGNPAEVVKSNCVPDVTNPAPL